MNQKTADIINEAKISVLSGIMLSSEYECNTTEDAQELAKKINAGFAALKLVSGDDKPNGIELTREQIKELAKFTGDLDPKAFVICHGIIPSHDSGCCPDYEGLIAYSMDPENSLVVTLDAPVITVDGEAQINGG